jgi:hypothetical protein
MKRNVNGRIALGLALLLCGVALITAMAGAADGPDGSDAVVVKEAAPPPQTFVAWEYRQLPITSDFRDWNRLGAEGWEYAGTFQKAIVFKRVKR